MLFNGNVRNRQGTVQALKVPRDFGLSVALPNQFGFHDPEAYIRQPAPIYRRSLNQLVALGPHTAPYEVTHRLPPRRNNRLAEEYLDRQLPARMSKKNYFKRRMSGGSSYTLGSNPFTQSGGRRKRRRKRQKGGSVAGFLKRRLVPYANILDSAAQRTLAKHASPLMNLGAEKAIKMLRK